MRDMIDERNDRERSSRSIVKGYNVHYMTPEELAERERQKMQKEEQKLPPPLFWSRKKPRRRRL